MFSENNRPVTLGNEILAIKNGEKYKNQYRRLTRVREIRTVISFHDGFSIGGVCIIQKDRAKLYVAFNPNTPFLSRLFSSAKSSIDVYRTVRS